MKLPLNLSIGLREDVIERFFYLKLLSGGHLFSGANHPKRTRVDKRVFWPQYFRKIEYVCSLGFILT